MLKSLLVLILAVNFIIVNNIEYFYEEDTLKILNFDSFQEINTSKINLNSSNLYLIPNKLITIDKKIQFINTEFLSFIQIHYYHLNGIDLDNTYLTFCEQTRSNLAKFIFILKSDFNIFLNKTWINDAITCKKISNISVNSLLNSKIDALYFDNNKFSSNICPIIFKNSNFQSLNINSMKNSMIKTNFIQFIDIEIANLNSKIDYVEFLNTYRLKLSSLILEKNVFKFIKSLKIDGILNKMETNDIFSNFNNLNLIILNLNNLREFFHYGLSWTTSLNQNNEKNITTNIEFHNKWNNELFYDFPEEDFCIMKDLYYNTQIELLLDTDPYLKNLENLSCTLLILIVKYNLFNLKYLVPLETCCQNNKTIFKNIYLNKCDIENRFKKCINPKSVDFSMNIIDYDELAQVLKFYFEIFIQPSICIIGILLNLCIIYLLKSSYTKKEFKTEIFYYIYYNSTFNFFILLIGFMKIIHNYQEYNFNFVYSIKFTYFSEYLFISMGFLESFLIFCSNFTLILFSLERLTLFNRNPSCCSKKFSKMPDKHIIIVVTLIGLSLNIIKFIEYEITCSKSKEDFPIEICKRTYQSYDDISNSTFTFYLIISLDFLLTFLFYFANLLIDIKLFKYYKDAIKQKSLLSIINFSNNVIEHNEVKKKNLFKMIIFYGVSNFLIRTPEFILSCLIFIHYLIYGKIFFGFEVNLDDFIYGENSLTDKFLHVSKVINTLCYLNNFFVLYFFNEIFRKNLHKCCVRFFKK